MFSNQTKNALINFLKKCCLHYFPIKSTALNHFNLSQINVSIKQQYSEIMRVELLNINAQNHCSDFVKGQE